MGTTNLAPALVLVILAGALPASAREILTPEEQDERMAAAGVGLSVHF